MHLLLALDAKRLACARPLASQQPYQLGMDFLGVTAILASNSQYLVEHVRLGYGHFEVQPSGRPDLTLLALEAGQQHHEASFASLLPERKAQDSVVVLLEGELIFLLRERASTAYYTTMCLFGAVVQGLKDRYCCLHAATISWEGRAAILCGAARCGKTSLTTNLIAQGFDFSSDDVTLVDRASLRVAAFPRAINVREEAQELPPGLLEGARRIGRFAIADQDRLIVDLGRQVPESVEPSVLCFPRYLPGCRPELQHLDKVKAFATLMQNRFHPMGEQLDYGLGQDFDALGRLAECCACFSLTFSDPALASRLVGELLLDSRTMLCD